MIKPPINILAIVSRLPTSFESRKDARLLDILRYLSKNGQVHLLYVQSAEGENNVKHEFKNSGIDVFSIKEKRKPGIYELELQIKEIIQSGRYGIVYFNGYYIAKYYLPYIEAYAPEAIMLIDSANSQFVSALEYARMAPEGVKRTVALKAAEKYRMAEIPILSHADCVILDRDNLEGVLSGYLPNVSYKVVKTENNVIRDENILSGIKKTEQEIPSVTDAVIVQHGFQASADSFVEKNIALLSQLEYVNIKKVEGGSFAECFNKIIGELNGKYTFFSGKNSLINERTLKDLLFCFKTNPRFGIVYPESNLTTGIAVNVSYIDDYILKHYRANLGNWEERKSVTGDCFLMKNELIWQIGSLDTRFKTLQYVLLDYSFRAFQAGYEIIKMKESFIYCKGFAGNDADDIIKDRKLLFSKWADRGTAYLETLIEKPT